MTTLDNALVSIIIPVYNEAPCIGKTISNLKSLLGKYEVIFVDGGSEDNTIEVIQRDFPVFISPKKGRACQMNYGASIASGGVLLFLHADSQIEPNSIEIIQRIIDKGHKAGCFKIRFDSKSPLMAMCAFFSSLRVKYRGIAFGDQGIFIQAEYFTKLGGFKEIPLMEDYRLSMDIKADGEKIKLSLERIITSERRFLKHGRLRTMWLMQKLQYMYRKGEDIGEISRLYRD